MLILAGGERRAAGAQKGLQREEAAGREGGADTQLSSALHHTVSSCRGIRALTLNLTLTITLNLTLPYTKPSLTLTLALT